MTESVEFGAICAKLEEQGWRLGCPFHADGLHFSYNDVPALPDSETIVVRDQPVVRGEFILITQDCDIVSPQELYVEALPVLDDAEKARSACRLNSTRFFPVRPDGTLVADRTRTIVISKQLLAQLTPLPWPSSSSHFGLFRQWLGKRHTRPALPDPVVDGLQKPLQIALNKLRKRKPGVWRAFNGLAIQIMIAWEDPQQAPVGIHLLILLGDISITEAGAAAVNEVKDVILASPDTALVRLLEEIQVSNIEVMSIRDYWDYQYLALDYFSYEGFLNVGALPESVLDFEP